ncbi:MAG: transposase [archaeon]
MLRVIKDEQFDLYGHPTIEGKTVFDLLQEVQVKGSCRFNQKQLGAFFPHEERRYSQDWSAYNAAKTSEDGLFKRLLAELLFLAVEEPIQGRGRPKVLVRNRILSMCLKVYYRSDLRKAVSILKELQGSYIGRAPSFKSLDNFFNDEDLSKLLDRLILITALPLASMERTGAIDATGFSTSRIENWNAHKWSPRKGQRHRTWRKAHAVVGTKTNVVLAVDVTEKNVSDISMVKTVVGDKTKYFDMENFVADKAYLSREVLGFLHRLGLNPYIPFKVNSRSHSHGEPMWNRLYRFFTDHQEEFMRKYHKRSNVETTFHMVKQRFGDHCLTKNFTANVNEIKTKFLCHNLCVLIQESFENNIWIDFSTCAKKISS